ncbi:hypothetical protein KXD93_04820 [Mucilaginibacter sp. BJC16-A38]|uniref:hypothetical protein n=1 Tax=Mucilaginibacter phenanthrenivorans TaxID=1234842 RepID=UPI0021587525|nr:hypothetical protein [Mucilaginibacter phenanthrenivorans]MCR8556949.1 hypothetical protein [Mucilaginibacter phenanthrenivorans]
MITLPHFTWQQFGLAAIGFLFIWYAVVLLWFGGRRLKAFFARGKPAVREPLPHVWETEEFMEDNLVGEATEPEGVTTHAWNSFGFTGRAKRNPDDELLGLVPDALEEIKTALHTVEATGGDKSDFISLFKLVSAKYERLKDGPHLAAINEWILENVPFALSEDELGQLWE